MSINLLHKVTRVAFENPYHDGGEGDRRLERVQKLLGLFREAKARVLALPLERDERDALRGTQTTAQA